VQATEVSAAWLREKLDQMHAAMFDKAKTFRDQNIRRADTYDQMKQILEQQGGFVRAWFKPSVENEKRIKDETKATVRCIPFDQPAAKGKCIYTGEETDTEVLFAIAY